jgi:hypothetical protein
MAGALRRPFSPGSIAPMLRLALPMLALSFAAFAATRAAAADPVCADFGRWRDDGTQPMPRWQVDDASARIADEGTRVFAAALVSPPFLVPARGLDLAWQQRRDLSWASSAGVLDVAIDGGDWRDFTAVGGRFDDGGYDARAFAGNPLGARPAWGRDVALSATRAQLPASLARHSVRLRFRLGSGGTGEQRSGWAITGFRCEAR